MTDECISPLRRRMIEDMTVRNFVPKTISLHSARQEQQFWVKDLGKDLEAFDDAGAGAVEIVIAIGDEDAGLWRTALKSRQPGRCARSDMSRRLWAISKPHGCTTMTSGSAATNSSHLSQGECWPACPNRFSPPAISTSSGIQLPPAISGSIHSHSWRRPTRRSHSAPSAQTISVALAISDTTRLGPPFPIGINADCFYHVGPRKREFSNHAMAQFPFLFFRHVPSIRSRHYVILSARLCLSCAAGIQLVLATQRIRLETLNATRAGIFAFRTPVTITPILP